MTRKTIWMMAALAAVDKGIITEERINQSVRRILKLKAAMK